MVELKKCWYISALNSLKQLNLSQRARLDTRHYLACSFTEWLLQLVDMDVIIV